MPRTSAALAYFGDFSPSNEWVLAVPLGIGLKGIRYVYVKLAKTARTRWLVAFSSPFLTIIIWIDSSMGRPRIRNSWQSLANILSTAA